ncbi:hypothetical protein LSH36_13g03044 [Paralvinella palmiformis]|uniref:Uncharacterized protein n=1 Tax=Paralvinella palmiformis TaxID=53620 RepID=A0AAD9KCX7_9ANNE|nr:hypothetical protein LSH36_13g03044 [Paralvinella palmiformis]
MAVLDNSSVTVNSSHLVLDYNDPTESVTSTAHCPGCSNATEDSGAVYRDTSSPDAFLYFVIVLTFYAVAMTVLMVKYVRRENQEAQLSYYFHEFINRDKFNTPQYRNKQRVRVIKRTLTRFYQSVRLSDTDKPPPAVKDLDRLSKNSGSSYFCSDSGVVSDRMVQDTSDLGSSHEGSDVENCHSDNELLNKEDGFEVRAQNVPTVKGQPDGRLLKELQMKESAV